MRILIKVAIISAGLLKPYLAKSQGTLYLSNLGQATTGSAPVGSDAWIAQDFGTGTNSGGYTLNSIQLLMGAALGSTSGFSVSLHSSVAGEPGGSLGSLGGVDPITGGLFNYTASGIMLSPSTLYFVVVTAGTTVATGSFAWSSDGDSNYDSSEKWLMDHLYFYSTDGVNWPVFDRANFFQMGIYATTVPEPSIGALMVAGAGLLVMFKRHKRL